MSAVMMVRDDRLDVDPKVFTPGHLAVIRDAAQEPSVQRIFVNAAIKKALCREAKGDRSWLSKIRPWWGHDYHFHIRMRCPPGSAECKGQPDQGGGEGCSQPISPTGSRIRSSIRSRRKSRRNRRSRDHDGAVAGRLPAGAGRAGCQAIGPAQRAIHSRRNALISARRRAVSASMPRTRVPRSDPNSRFAAVRGVVMREPNT